MKNGKIIVLLFAMLLMTVFALSSCQLIDSFLESPVEPAEHKLSKVDEVPATCTTDGHEAYYTCSGCDLLFADAEGAIILDAPVVIPGGHAPEIVPGLASTCTQDGYTASRKCSVCDEVITPAKELKATHDASPEITLVGFTLENIDGKAYVVVYGNNVTNNTCNACGEAVAPKIAMNFQHNHNIDGLGWGVVKSCADNNNLLVDVTDDTVIEPAVTATMLDNGYFEARFEVTDFQVGWTLTIHAGLDGNMQDCKNQGTGDGVAVYADGKKFSFLKNKDTTWNIISLVVSDATENEYNLNGRMSLEDIDGVPYVVYNGSWNTKGGDAATVKAAIEGSYFSIQQFQNGWKTTVCTPTVEVNADGTINVKLSLDGLAVTGAEYPFYMHYGLTKDTQKDTKIHTDIGNSSIVVGDYKYEIKKGCDLDTTWTTTLTVIYITENES